MHLRQPMKVKWMTKVHIFCRRTPLLSVWCVFEIMRHHLKENAHPEGSSSRRQNQIYENTACGANLQ